ncbi:hypothetical protein K435DRAFT_728374 [Dendrothele bispora CBS 962.96]|uniref:MYND-type domain-containing protein n=1 Tax=Dendrothele bispora (strain CBS 962.96) TaxID=1314807 RepID=A0A4V4HEC4_DENBC|nr:hypothetical protein K435DRAFT_728374 [Dendrothele bispora CBS 962.96]
MRESNFAFPVQNKACVCITSQLYDRRALDTTSPLPLFNSLTHLIYLTSTSARIREIMTMDGGLERLVRMLYEFCICPPPPENHALFYGLASPSARPAKSPPTLNPVSYDKHAAYRFSLGFQCLVNIGVRGNEAIRSRVVQAGTLEVVGCVLEAWLASKGFAVGPGGQGVGGYGHGFGRRETREQRHARRQQQRMMDEAAELARALQRQMNHTELPPTGIITEVDSEEPNNASNSINNEPSTATPTSASFDQSFDHTATNRDRSGTVIAPRHSQYSSMTRTIPERPAGPSPIDARNLRTQNSSSGNESHGSHPLHNFNAHAPFPSSHSSSSSSIPISGRSRASPTPSSISASSTDASRPSSPPSSTTSRHDTETEGEDDVDMEVENVDPGSQHQHQRTVTHRTSRGTVRGGGRRNSTAAQSGSGSGHNQTSIGVDSGMGVPVGVGGMGGPVPVGVNDGMPIPMRGMGMGVGVNDGMGMGTMGMGGIPMTMGGMGMGMEDGILVDVELQNNEDFAMGAPPGAPGAMTNGVGGVGALGLQGDLGRFGAPPPAVDGDTSMSEGEGTYSRGQSVEPEDQDRDSEMAVDTTTTSALDMEVRSLDERESQDILVADEERATRSEGEETVSGLGTTRSGTIRMRRDPHTHEHRPYTTRPDVTPRAGVIGLPPSSAGPVPMTSASRTVMPGDPGIGIREASPIIIGSDDGQRSTGTVRQRSGTVAPRQNQQQQQQQSSAEASGSGQGTRRLSNSIRELLESRTSFENIRQGQVNITGSDARVWAPRDRTREASLRGQASLADLAGGRARTSSGETGDTTGNITGLEQNRGHHRHRAAAGGSATNGNAPPATTSPTPSIAGTVGGAGTITATASIASTPSHGGQNHSHHPTPVSCPYRDEDVLLSLQLLAYLSKYPHVRQAFYKKRDRFHPASGIPPGSSTSSSLSMTPGPSSNGRIKGKERERERDNTTANLAAAFLGQTSTAGTSSSGSRLFRAFSNATTRGAGKEKDKREKEKEKEKDKDKDKDRVKGISDGDSGSNTPLQTNMFALVERFTFRPSSSELAEAANGGTAIPPRLPPEIQYWAAVIMRNACRKDDGRGGIRQCANMLCGKWETFPREFAKCRRCRKAKYCGKECQSTAWSAGHRFWCSVRDVDGEVGDDTATLTGGRARTNVDNVADPGTGPGAGGINANMNQETDIPIDAGEQEGSDVRIGTGLRAGENAE